MSNINLFDRVTANTTFPTDNIERGSVGVVMDIHGDHEGYTVEFLDGDGFSRGIVTAHACHFDEFNSEPTVTFMGTCNISQRKVVSRIDGTRLKATGKSIGSVCYATT